MVESSKILTVSYGTFSCTLEGFDDSFGTMKAIAEYFRDLAADDRYFGAEPPTPDVHMLAKIAEREITRRVDARTEDGGIVLRASEAVAPAMPPQAERPDPVQVAAAAVVAPRMASTPTDPTLDDFQTALSDATADDMEPVAGPEAEDEVSSPLVASGQATPSGLTFDHMVEDASAVPAHPDAESVAAKLQRIRAVVGKAAPKPDDVEFAEDLTEVPAVVQAPVQEVAEDVAPEMEAFEADFDAESVMDNSDTSHSLVSDMMAEADDTQDDLADMSLGADQLAEDIAAADDEYDVEAFDDAAAATGDDDDTDDVMLSNLQAKVAQQTSVDAPEVAEEAPVVHAQILRLRKGELEERSAPEVDVFATQDDVADDEMDSDLDEADYDIDDDIDFMDDDLADIAALDGADELDELDAPIVTSLSDEDEADLMEELAELERDYDDAPAPKAQKPRHSLPETDDATMSHLLSQTNQELSEPEGNRRRNAIAQLKAAVAATEAARQLGDKGSNDSDAENAFRGDLDDVVRSSSRPAVPARPTRVEAPAARTERPRPAPLKLVASQRVDAVEAAPATTVQPRRIAATATEVSAAAASNFAEFAEEMGASSLSDLLEAAAAYTAFVEGNEDFSRPQIMKKVQLTAETEFSREDGLRSFGTLLRQGRISKVRNGRFQVSEETRFRPESKVG